MSITIGELNNRISVLELRKSINTYSWEVTTGIWAKVELLQGYNIFSKVGIGTRSIKFTIRNKKDLTLHNSFLWKGKHCFITGIVPLDRAYFEVSAALIEPRICTVEREGKPILDELNRPVYTGTEILSFPCCLTEKYIGHTQGEPMVTIETTYVIVTPKSVELDVSEVVMVDGTPYVVLTTHVLDEYKNEYEISVKRDS